MIIPIILVFTVVIAGVFAFMPIENASSVHTTIMENTQRIDEILITTVTADDDLRIFCPTASDACRILEIYFEDTDLDTDLITLGALTGTINSIAGVGIVANLGTTINDGMQAVAGVSGVTFGGGDNIRIAIADGSDAYNAVIFIQVEGNTEATATFAP